MFSIWERNSFLFYDNIIIGGGLVGINTAIQLKIKYPKQQVLILERGWLPTGASTKNAGFACMGSVGELADDLKNASADDIIQLFLYRLKGLQTMRQLLGDSTIGYIANGSHEVIMHSDTSALDALEKINSLFKPAFNKNIFIVNNKNIDVFGFNKQHVNALIENTLEGQIDTGKMMKSLIQYAIQLGVEIKTGIQVSRFEEGENKVDVTMVDPLSKQEIILSSKTLAICTNAFSKALLPTADIEPGRGQVLITKPIPSLKLKGIFHKDKGYVYFRAYNGCVLIGGGRHLYKEQENTTSFDVNNDIQTYLENELSTYILPNTPIEIDLRWTGIMAFGKSKYPIVKKHSDKIYIAVRMGGMGVAIGSEVAKEVVSLMTMDA